MISGFHTLVYSHDAEATRAFFRDVLHWPSVDAGDGWLIFKTAPSELGVHPTSSDGSHAPPTVPLHQASLMCDDIEATVDELRAQGVTFTSDVIDEGFCLVTHLEVPGAGTMQLYQPRHDVAHSLPG